MRKRQRQRCVKAAFRVARGLFALATCGPAAAGTQCDNKACFEQQFAGCEPASYATAEVVGARARYHIEGPVEDGCKVTFRFLKNPKPDWVDKPLHMVLDPGKPFGPQAKDAVKQCLANDLAGPYQCSGPLRGALAWSPARKGDGPVPEAEAAAIAQSLAGRKVEELGSFSEGLARQVVPRPCPGFLGWAGRDHYPGR